jgi:NAD(P)-dependent dehydrogenase (short-subunit alcohol dehydrogenase family)
MNIAVFGASGKIGSLLVHKALANGDTVFAYVRNPDKLRLQHENLKIIKGQLNDEAAMTTAIEGADVVISTLGPDMKGKAGDTSTPVADGHALMIRIMEKFGKKRLITLATPTLPAEDDKKSAFFSFLRKMAPNLMGHAVRDLLKMGEAVTASDLDWTIIRIINPNLKSNGKGYALAVGSEKHKMSVSRENVANSFYDVAKAGSYIHKMPIVFNK